MAQVVVIGAGLGGLAAAARLSALGHRVTVCERSAVTGGKLGRFSRDGFSFDTAQMPQKFGASQGGGQACRNCHGGGAFGFAVDTNSLLYFTTISTSLSQLLKYFAVDAGAVTINMTALTNAGSGSITTHPLFDPMLLVGMPALQEFYNLTKTAQAAGPCAAPTAVNP